MSLKLEDALPEKRAARRAFDRARDFDDASFVHDEARTRLIERLDLLRIAPTLAIDLGCATGRAANALAARYPLARVVAIDSSARMVAAAVRAAVGSVVVVQADAERVPLADQSAELVFANLVLPSCRPERVFAEVARVLKAGGAFTFATLGPESLGELRRAFAAVDDRIHVHAALDLHQLGDLAVAAGLAEPVLDVERFTVTYPDLATLVRDLRATGAVNVAAARRKTLTGRRRWQRFEQALWPAASGRLAVTIELVLGQAWGRGARQARARGAEVAIPLERIGRRA